MANETTTKNTVIPTGFFDSSYSIVWSIPEQFSFFSLLSHAKDTLFNNLSFFIQFGVLLCAVTFIPSFVINALLDQQSLLKPLLRGVLFIWQFIIQFGATRIMLQLINKKSVTFRELFIFDRSNFGIYLWTNIRYSLQVILGFFLFIIPGIYWAIKYQYASLLVIDKGFMTGDAMYKSAQLTRGNIFRLGIYGIGFGLLNAVGALLFMLGLLITLPITIIATFSLYKMLEKNLPTSKLGPSANT